MAPRAGWKRGLTVVARGVAAVVALVLPRTGGMRLAMELYEGLLPLAGLYAVKRVIDAVQAGVSAGVAGSFRPVLVWVGIRSPITYLDVLRDELGLVGVLQFGRLTQGDPTVAIGLELDIIAAVVIGGTSLFGGRGKIIWTVFGVVFLVLLGNALSLLNVPFFYVAIVKGSVILLAALLDVVRRRLALQQA